MAKAESTDEFIKEVKNGKISQREAENKFETIKKMQVASTIINTAAAIVGAIAGAYQHLGPIAAPIVAGIQSAAIAAAGAVQLAQIRRTQLGSSTTISSNPSTPDVNSITNDFTPAYTQNITADSEISALANAVNSKPIYVSVTDIEDTQNMVHVRDEETTY